MSDKKELNNEELQEVSGGIPYLGTGEPTVNNFYHHVGDRINYGQFVDGNWVSGITYTVVALGKLYTGGNAYVKGYSLYYKLETVDRSKSYLDGWYDYVSTIANLRVIHEEIRRVPDTGIQIVE